MKKDLQKKTEEIKDLKNRKDEISKNILEMATANKEFENKIVNLETIKTEKTDLVESRNKKVRDLEPEKKDRRNKKDNKKRFNKTGAKKEA